MMEIVFKSSGRGVYGVGDFEEVGFFILRGRGRLIISFMKIKFWVL